MRVLILLALLGSVFAAPEIASRITGGSETTAEVYPFMMNLEHHESNVWWTHACGGVLLNSRVGMTAGNCISGDSPEQWQARLGSSYASTGGSIHRIARFALHELHDGFRHDIALISFVIRAIFTNVIQAATIPASNHNVDDNSLVTGVGWGTLSLGGEYPDQLHHTSMYVVNRSVCAERYEHLQAQPGFEHWPSVTESMLCTGILDVGGSDTCDGDAGGPIVYNGNMVCGVISGIHSCGHPSYPGMNTDVAFHSDWIVATAANIQA